MTFDDVLALLPADPEPVVVLVVRDPDSANEITVFGNDDAIVYDVDLGYPDLCDRDEFLDWAESEYEGIEALPKGHPARRIILDLVETYGERHDLTGHGAIKAAIKDQG